jgi:predicted protein tyrosine phosphatase
VLKLEKNHPRQEWRTCDIESEVIAAMTLLARKATPPEIAAIMPHGHTALTISKYLCQLKERGAALMSFPPGTPEGIFFSSSATLLWELNKILFVCSYGQVRSVAAANLLTERGFLADYCGLYDAGVYSFTDEQIIGKLRLATTIMVMEDQHKTTLNEFYAEFTKGKPVIVLGIPDEFSTPDDPKLREQIELKVKGFNYSRL